MHRSSILAATAALFAPALSAQDECTSATPITLGVNGPFNNTTATTSATAFPCIGAGNDLWFVYRSTCPATLVASTCGADFDTVIEIFDGSAGCAGLTSLVCNDDSCGRQSEASTPAVVGGVYYIRVGGWVDAAGVPSTGNFPLKLSCNFDLQVLGTAEATPGAGTLSAAGGKFEDGWDLRWNFDDPSGTFNGSFGAIVANVGLGGSSAIGVTPQIPGFDQLWGGSTPGMPSDALVFPPMQVGNADFSVNVPTGLFSLDDTVRIQGIILDTSAAGSLPVIPTTNTIEWQFTRVYPCVLTENFDALASGVGNYPTGWSNGGGTNEWQVDSGGTTSSNTGPSAAVSGANYMYCETSLAAGTYDWKMNTAVYPSATFVNNAISFQLSRVGAAIGTLEVRMDDGSGTYSTLLKTYNGESLFGNEWDLEVLALPTPLPANVSFQFNYFNWTTFTGDIAIDDFCLN